MNTVVVQSSSYSPVAKVLHWSIAVLIAVDFLLALYFAHIASREDNFVQTAYLWHMSAGMWVLALSIARVVWRMLHTYPRLPADMGRYARWLAKSAHALLYVYMLIVPVSGWVVLTLRRQSAPLVSNFTWPGVPFLNTATTHEQRVAIYQALLPAHIVISYAGLGLIGLHVAAALYHHYYRRDDVLMRMLPLLRQHARSTVDRPEPRTFG